MTRRHSLVGQSAAALTLTLILSSAPSNAADQIMFDAFTGGQTTEDFEGFVEGPNIVASSFGDRFLLPGSASVFDFGSGVSLTNPIPNPGAVNGILLGDFIRGEATWSLGANGIVASETDVVSGSAYLGVNAFNGLLELSFDAPQTRVGAFVIGDGVTDITMEAFDDMGMSLGTATVSPVMVSDWGINFLGLEDELGIAKITISGEFVALDDLTFETGSVEPPPEFCQGDADGNGMVNFSDITTVLFRWLDVCE